MTRIRDSDEWRGGVTRRSGSDEWRPAGPPARPSRYKQTARARAARVRVQEKDHATPFPVSRKCNAGLLDAPLTQRDSDKTWMSGSDERLG